MSLFSIIYLLLLSLSSAVSSDAVSFQKLSTGFIRSEPESIAFDSTGKGFYTGVSGGLVLKYTPETGFVNFAKITPYSDSRLCDGIRPDRFNFCGRPMGIAFNEKTGDLYIADAPRGLHVVSPAGGVAVRIASSVDGKPLGLLDGLDVDPTTGVVYFTSLTSSLLPNQFAWLLNNATGKLYKYDPSTGVVSTLMEGLNSSAGCAVSSDGSFVLVSQFQKSNIKKYWIKGPKAGSSEDFANSILNPQNIRRIGSTGNFWVASAMVKDFMPFNQSAVKVNSNSEVLQTIILKDHIGDTVFNTFSYLTEVNEFNSSLYLGTTMGSYVGILKL